MVVYIYRRHFTRWGIEGTLVIKGSKVCDTLEHPTCYFPAGEYEITLFSPILAGEKSRKMPIVLIRGRDRLFGKWVLILLVSNPVMDR